MPHYSLLYERWIPVVRTDGTPDELGLVDVLRQAHRLRSIQGEAPVVTAALHRLVIAFAHRALKGPKTMAEWRTLWTAERFDEWQDAIDAYATTWADAFDLGGAKHPFMQCPDLPDEKVGSPAQLILGKATGGNATLFDHTTNSDVVELPADVATRWLVTIQAFDTGGLKTPYKTDKTSQRGLCNLFGVALLQGKNLKETLLLNMVNYAPAARTPDATRADDRPIWEQDPPGPEPVKDPGRPPLGWTDLLTWPTRRVRLQMTQRGGKTVVTGAAITPGTRYAGKLDTDEQMAAFSRKPLTQKRRDAGAPPNPWRPVQVEELRGVWPHATEFLLAASDTRKRPKVIEAASERFSDKSDRTFTLRVFGQQLDSNGGAVETWFEEALPAPVSLLRAQGPARSLEVLLGLAVKFADDAGSELRSLESNYARELSAKPPSPILGVWYWPELPAPFHDLLHRLGTALVSASNDEVLPEAVPERFKAWGTTVKRTALSAGERWVWDNPNGSGRQLLALAQAENIFRGRIEKLAKKYEQEVDDHS